MGPLKCNLTNLCKIDPNLQFAPYKFAQTMHIRLVYYYYGMKCFVVDLVEISVRSSISYRGRYAHAAAFGDFENLIE